jgi:two-component system response regulator DegU
MTLTERQREILRLATLPNKQIAQRLGITQKTVKNHLTRILRKLRAENRIQALLTAMRQGIISLDEVHPGDVCLRDRL